MLKSGDRVMYGVHGICQVVGFEKQKVGTSRVEYIVLEPTAQPRSRFYVPANNESAVAKLHPIISSSDIAELLSSPNNRVDTWIEDENKRKQYYKELIGSCDRAALVRMVYSLHIHKMQQEKLGKKMHLCDTNFLRDAEKLLSSEFALVLGIKQEEVNDYVRSYSVK